MRREDHRSQTSGGSIGWTAATALLSSLLSAAPGGAESWRAMTTTNAPSARAAHTAVWTGSKMILWGGQVTGSWLNTGGIYDPSTDSWTATSTTNAPAGRTGHTAVWTGSKMIVWGGSDGSVYLNTGGIYDPSSNTWAATSTTGAPTARAYHTAVWTGSRMIVWGGTEFGPLGTGGIYNPGTDSWTATIGVGPPDARENHTAVWTGSKMIVWGGFFLASAKNTGGVFDAATNWWTTATSTTNAPTARAHHSAVWTGSRMIIWGAATDTSGGLYDPATDSWTATSTVNAPGGRFENTAARMGSKMIVWGGTDGALAVNTGGIYDLVGDTWTATTVANAPPARRLHTAVWTGSRMIVWGGVDLSELVTNTGAIYAPPGTEGPLVAGTDRVFPLIPQCGIPDGAQALAVNLAVTQPSNAGHLRLYPAGSPLPNVSSINYSAGQTRANNAVVTPNVSGEVAVRCAQASGTVHLILDVTGYFDASGSFFALTPCRAVDTRNP